MNYLVKVEELVRGFHVVVAEEGRGDLGGGFCSHLKQVPQTVKNILAAALKVGEKS